MLKTLLLVFVFFLVIRFIGRRFLQGPKKKNSNFRFFYQTFKNVREQQKKKQQKQPSGNGKVKKDNLDHIEEAEYEDVTDDDTKS